MKIKNLENGVVHEYLFYGENGVDYTKDVFKESLKEMYKYDNITTEVLDTAETLTVNNEEELNEIMIPLSTQATTVIRINNVAIKLSKVSGKTVMYWIELIMARMTPNTVTSIIEEYERLYEVTNPEGIPTCAVNVYIPKPADHINVSFNINGLGEISRHNDLSEEENYEE